MGYSSHTLLAITAVEDVTLRLTNPLVIDVLECADRTLTLPGESGDVFHIYEWDYIKWYNSWAPVAALEAWMDSAECDTDDYPFGFLRMGENIEDLESRGSPWEFNLHYGVNIEDDPTPRVTDAHRKALALILAMVEGEWGAYMEPDMKIAVGELKTLL